MAVRPRLPACPSRPLGAQCSGCDTFTLQPVARVVPRERGEPKIVRAQGPPVERLCEHCGNVHHMGGPLWSGPMHDPEFVRALLHSLHEGDGRELASSKRLIGMLTAVQEELLDVPLFHHLAHMCNVLHVRSRVASCPGGASANARCPLPAAHCLLPAARCPLLAARCSPRGCLVLVCASRSRARPPSPWCPP